MNGAKMNRRTAIKTSAVASAGALVISQKFLAAQESAPRCPECAPHSLPRRASEGPDGWPLGRTVSPHRAPRVGTQHAEAGTAWRGSLVVGSAAQ